MPIVTFTSGSKGGTGKSTLSSILALKLARSTLTTRNTRRQLKVLLIDMGEGGSSTLLALGGDPGPPYLVDFLVGRAGLDIVCQSPYSPRLYVAPAPPRLSILPPLTRLPYLVAWGERMFDFVIIDLPAYPGNILDTAVDLGHIAVLVFNPDSLSFSAAKNAYTGKSLVLPVLNKYHPKFRSWLEKAREYWNNAFTFPFDPALTFMAVSALPDAYELMKDETKEELGLLAQRILRPFIKISR